MLGSGTATTFSSSTLDESAIVFSREDTLLSRGTSLGKLVDGTAALECVGAPWFKFPVGVDPDADGVWTAESLFFL